MQDALAAPHRGSGHVQERWGSRDKGPTAQAGCHRAHPCICSRVNPTAAGNGAETGRSEGQREERFAKSQGCSVQREGAVMLWAAPAAA